MASGSEAARYVQDVVGRLRDIFARVYPGWEVVITAEGDFPQTVLKVATPGGRSDATFGVWDADWNDLDEWDEPGFLSAELFRYYDEGYRG